MVSLAQRRRLRRVALHLLICFCKIIIEVNCDDTEEEIDQ